MGNPVRPHDNCGGLSAWEFSRARAQARACRENAKEDPAINHLRRLWPGAPWANLDERPLGLEAAIGYHTLDGNVLGLEQPLQRLAALQGVLSRGVRTHAQSLMARRR